MGGMYSWERLPERIYTGMIGEWSLTQRWAGEDAGGPDTAMPLYGARHHHLHRNGRLDVVGYSPHDGNHENAWVQQFQPYGALAAEGGVNPNGVVEVSEAGLAEQSGAPRRRMLALGLTGKQFDPETGLYYFGYRWYSPELMRWTQQEPAGLDGPNAWQFTFANPNTLVDMNGLLAIDPTQWINCLGYAFEQGQYVEPRVGQPLKDFFSDLGYNCKQVATSSACSCKDGCPAVMVYFYDDDIKPTKNYDPFTDGWIGERKDRKGNVIEDNDLHAIRIHKVEPIKYITQDVHFSEVSGFNLKDHRGDYGHHVKYDIKPLGPNEDLYTPDATMKRWCCCPK